MNIVLIHFHTPKSCHFFTGTPFIIATYGNLAAGERKTDKICFTLLIISILSHLLLIIIKSLFILYKLLRVQVC